MTVNLADLVDNDRGWISRRILWDQEIYQLELERIYLRCWLLLGHESQVAQPGQYFTTWMGDEPIIVTRDRNLQVQAMINSCRHRGNSVCRADAGQTRSFLCAYHGWTYGLDGSLIGVPGDEERYHGDLDRSQWVIRVPQVATYKGLIFGTFDPGAPPLEEYLGQTRWALDYILDQRAGGTEVVGGVYKWLIKSNWKLGADNIMGDNYHSAVTHRSAQMVGHMTLARNEHRNGLPGQGAARDPGASRGPRPGFTAPLAWGHGFMTDLQATGAADLSDYPEPLRNYYQETEPELANRLGADRARVKKINLTVFPNLCFNTSSNSMRVWQPRGPDETEVWLWTLVDKDAPPEVKRQIRQISQRHFSPAGLFEQDDMDNWELTTRAAGGHVSRNYPLHYAMGLGHEQWATDGVVTRQINAINDESNQRTYYKGWADFMSGADWDELRRRRAAWEGAPRPERAGTHG